MIGMFLKRGGKALASGGLTALLLALPAPALAQLSSEPQDLPEGVTACLEDQYRQFDFWLGEWEVTDTEGNLAGHNSITHAENGCVILEHWSGARGSTGRSFNYFDPGDRKWHQLWIAPGAVIDYAGGPEGDNTMKLEGTIAYRNSGVFPFRGSWVLNEDGTVTQSFEQYDPVTDDWSDWFTGIYRRVEDDAGAGASTD